ncbi:MAG: hypothetical protein AB7E32_02535 [Desulfovibrio sp.]
MTAAISGRSAQASQEYARAAQQARAETLRAQNGDSPARARVRTRTFGFQLGSFGLTYTSEDVQLEPTRSAASPARSTFDQSLETATLRSEMVTTAASQTLSDIPAQRRSGLRAYQDALSASANPISRTLLAVA